jgi:hypothetical protein
MPVAVSRTAAAPPTEAVGTGTRFSDAAGAPTGTSFGSPLTPPDPTPDADPDPTADDPSPITAAPGPAPTPAPTATPEELVARLFDPLLRRLKTELRLDRERRGVLTDIRH